MKDKKTSHPKREAIINFLTMLFIFMAAGAFVSTISGVSGDSDRISNIFNSVAYLASGIFSIWFVKKTCGRTILQAVDFKHFDIFVLLFSIICPLSLSYVVMHLCGLILSSSTVIESNSSVALGIGLIVEAVIVAPLAEELIFRFGGIEILKREYKAPFAIIIVTVLFAVMHAYNIQGITAMLTISLIWTVVYYYTGNVIYTIAGHIIYNSLQLVDKSKLIIFGSPAYYLKNGFIMCSIPWLVIQLVILLVMVIYFVMIFRKKYGTVFGEQAAGLPSH